VRKGRDRGWDGSVQGQVNRKKRFEVETEIGCTEGRGGEKTNKVMRWEDRECQHSPLKDGPNPEEEKRLWKEKMVGGPKGGMSP